MGLITKLKSLLGLAEDRPQPRSSESGVTIEREPDESNEGPDAETERAIKTADETVDGDETAATEADVGDVDETDPTAHIERVESDSAESNGTEEDASGAEETETEGPETEEPTPSEADADARPLEDVKGIGPAYAERLRSAGVEDTAALADADPEEIAAETDLSPKRIAGWVERAKSL